MHCSSSFIAISQVFVDGDVVESYVGAKIEPLKKLIYKHLGVDEEPEKGTQ